MSFCVLLLKQMAGATCKANQLRGSTNDGFIPAGTDTNKEMARISLVLGLLLALSGLGLVASSGYFQKLLDSLTPQETTICKMLISRALDERDYGRASRSLRGVEASDSDMAELDLYRLIDQDVVDDLVTWLTGYAPTMKRFDEALYQPCKTIIFKLGKAAVPKTGGDEIHVRVLRYYQACDAIIKMALE